MNVLVEHFQLNTADQLPLRFNIAPTQLIAVVRRTPGAPSRELSLLRWGLVPSWAKDATTGSPMINARAETVAEKPTFRTAFRRRRCLIPADGYYEWQKVGARKQPYYIRLRDGQPFAFAGLWEGWRGGGAEGDQPLETCTIITTDANELSRPIHDRMPVILSVEDYDLWLDPGVEERAKLESLLQPYDPTRMAADPVSTFVNNVRNDDDRCVAMLGNPPEIRGT